MTDIVRRDVSLGLIPTADEMQNIRLIGQAFAGSGMFSDLKDEAQAVVKILWGRELGISPVTAIRGIHSITVNGKTSVELHYRVKGALINQSGRWRWMFARHNDEVCELAVERRDDTGWTPAGTVEYTIEDARRAGLASRDTWKQHPKDMLFARAISRVANRYCPELFLGVLAGDSGHDDDPPEELERAQLSRDVTGATVGAPPYRTLEAGDDPARVRRRIFALCRDLGYDDDQRHALQRELVGRESLTDCTATELDLLVDELEARKRSAADLELAAERRENEDGPDQGSTAPAAEGDDDGDVKGDGGAALSQATSDGAGSHDAGRVPPEPEATTAKETAGAEDSRPSRPLLERLERELARRDVLAENFDANLRRKYGTAIRSELSDEQLAATLKTVEKLPLRTSAQGALA